MTKFNHAFTIAFEVTSTNDGHSVTEKELLIGLTARLASLLESGEIVEACGLPYDSYDVD